MNREQILISVVTPTYKRFSLLCKSVKSVMAQTHRRIEHIIVGDGCPELDEARSALLTINPQLIIHNLSSKEPKPTYGPARIARVRNAGIALASGEYIAHLDDDNTWDAGHIESLLDAFERCPDAAAAFSYRKLLIEGTTPYLFPYHPWKTKLDEAAQVYNAYERMGIYQRNSHIMRDRISFHEERDVTVDTNELLVRRDIHAMFLFLTSFSEAMMREEIGEDDAFCEMIYRRGYRVVASGQFSLNFRVGGQFTQELLFQIAEEKHAKTDGQDL